MKKVGSLIVALLIGVLGLFLTACTPNYSKVYLTASYQQSDDGSLQLNINESAEIEFEVKNMPKNFNPSLNYSASSNKITTQVVDFDSKSGITTLKITGISYGECVLRTTTMEGGKYVDIKIKVNLAIKDFVLKDEVKLFAVRGNQNPQKLILDNSYFSFAPYETTQKEIIWYDEEDNIITEIDGNNYSGVNEIKIFAKSPYLDKKVEVKVEIIDEIGDLSINKLIYDQNTDNYTVGEQIDINNKKASIILVGNKSAFAREYIRLNVDSNNELLKNKNTYLNEDVVLATTFDTTTTGQADFKTFFDISLQALKQGVTNIVFSVYYDGYNGYEVSVELEIKVVSAPEKLLINDIENKDFVKQILYDNVNSTVETNLTLTTAPNTAVFDKVEIIYSPNFFEYIKLTCGGVELVDQNQNIVLTNLSLPIVAKGIKSSGVEVLSLTFKLYWGENIFIQHNEQPLEYTVEFEVKTGASSLNIDNDYLDGNIYVDINKGEQIFEHLYVTEQDAWIQGLQIYNMSTENVAELQEYNLLDDQRQDGKTVALKINPIKVGTSRYSVYLQNGVFRNIYVHVIDQPQNVTLDLASNQSNVTLKQYDNLTNNLSSFILQLDKNQDDTYFAQAQFEVLVNGLKETLENSKLYTLVLNEEQSDVFDFDEQTKTVNVTNNYNGQVISWQVFLKTVENFKLVENNDIAQFEGTIKMVSFVPIYSATFSLSEVYLYSENTLGINYKDEAKETILLQYNPVFENLDINQLKITWNASIDNSFSNDILTITNYGTYNTKTGEFVLNVSTANPQSFNVIANIEYFGQTISASFKVNPLDYIQVTSVKLNNYVEKIYLSPTHDYVDLYTYVLPSDAIHKQLLYRFEPDAGSSSSIISLQAITDTNGVSLGVRVNYGNAGGGSGELVIIAQSTITSFAQTPQSALRIPLTVGDGSYLAPYKITTAEEFLAINNTGLDKHYIIESTIDLSNKKASFGEFTGTINGLNVGKIIGINIDSFVNNNAGLFSFIKTKQNLTDYDKDNSGNYHSGEIKNLIFEGCFNLTVTNKANIGFVCAELGTNTILENITVILKNSSIIVNTLETVNIGGVVGKNEGTIVSYVGSYQYNLTQNNSVTYEYKNNTVIDMTDGVLEIAYAQEKANELGSIGGIVGENNGKIYKQTLQNKNLIGKNNYFAIVNIKLKRTAENEGSSATFVLGGLVGKNLGIITAYDSNGQQDLDHINLSNYIKTQGKLTINAQDNNVVGGIIGINNISSANLSYVVTRIKLHSTSAGKDGYIGGIYGVNTDGTINNCVIQALENGTSIGIEATTIYSANFGLIETDVNGNKDYALDNNKVSVFGKGSIYDQNSTFATGVSNLKATTYIGQKVDNGNIVISGREMVAPPTYMTINNYYGDIYVGSTNVGSGYFQQQFEQRQPTLVVSQEKNPMYVKDDENAIKFAYLYFNQAKNETEQHLLNALNQLDLPFNVDGEISIISFNPDIIHVTSDGKLFLQKTGICKLRIQSNLNAKLYQDVYVYVVGAFDGFMLTINPLADTENIIDSGRVISVLSNNSLALGVHWIKQSYTLNGYDIQMLAGNQANLINVQIPQNQCFDFEKVGNIYLLKALNNTGTQDFDLKLYLTYAIDGKIYSSLYVDKGDIDNDLDDTIKGYLTYLEQSELKEYQMYFTAQNKQGATNVFLTKGESITLEPTDKYQAEIEILTDSFNENVEVLITKYQNNAFEQSNFVKIEENYRTITISVSDLWDKLEAQELEEVSQNIYKFDLTYSNKVLTVYVNNTNKTLSLDLNEQFTENLTLQLEKADNYNFAVKVSGLDVNINKVFSINKLNIYYNIAFDSNLNQDYVGRYFVTYNATSTNISKALEITVLQQEINKLLVESFEGGSKEDINAGKQQSPYINPGTANHFKVSVVPMQAEYDYVEVVSNSDKFLLTWIDTNANILSGAQIIPNGLRFTKQQFDQYNGVIYVNYLIGTGDVENGQVYNFDIIAYKDNQVVIKSSKQITIKFAKDVTLTLLNKQKINNFYYLTRGLNYDYQINMLGYTNDEIIIESSRNDILSVNKATKQICITKNNITYADNQTGGVVVTLKVYGKKQVDGQTITSVPDTISLLITEYLINEDENSTIIKNGSNGVVSVSMGDYYVFDTQLISNLNAEFSGEIPELSSTTKLFTDVVTSNAIWQYQVGIADGNGGYLFSNNANAWITINGDISAEETNKNFVIEYNNGKIKFTPLKVHDSNTPAYKFRLLYGYYYDKGVAKYQQYNDAELRPYGSVIDEFVVNVYQLSSIDTPTPISNLKELMSMEQNSYYIMLEDIELTSEFVPINVNIAGFDGNGKKLILSSNFSTDTLSNFGIFETIYQNSLIRNVTIEISNSIRWTFNNTGSVHVGLLAGENRGIITNCSVVTKQENTIRFIFNQTTSSSVYVGGLVGVNNGYITNSRVNANITSSSNLAGLVCNNNGKIASSAVYNSLIINTSNDQTTKTGGFVCYNEGDLTSTGIILTSYISGVHTGNLSLPIYANDSSKQIRTSTETAGFVYSNKGKITDCYSDIPVVTSSKSAGFVFNNSGAISNSFSTSLLKSLSQESYGFVYDNAEGKITDCSYLSEPELVNYSINLSNSSIKGLSVYNIAKFANAENFNTFAFGESSDITKGIWFYPNNTSLNMFNFEDKTFVLNRPELLSANIIAKSVQELNLEATITDEQTGEVTYAYVNLGEQQGSILNPYIIVDATYLEDYILKSNSNSINFNCYRLVSDVDYEKIVNSNLYNTVFAGDIEGNGMIIQNYTIDTSQNLASAGLFSKIGNGNTQQGCVKNLTVKPKYINLPNAICVGALSGTLDGGYLFNVNVDGKINNTNLVVLGKNIVGGMVGRAISNFKIVNCTSSISANSTYRSQTVLGQTSSNGDEIASYFLQKTHTLVSMSKTSYAGSIAGVLAGTGYVSRVSVNGNVASIGEFAGLLFGGIGNGVKVISITQNITAGQFIQPAVYGGVIAGESYGYISNVNLTCSTQIQSFFKTIPFVPNAVGGIVGLLGDSTNLPNNSQEYFEQGMYGLNNVRVHASLYTGYINNIGGIVGEMIGGKIYQSGINGSVSGYQNVGGIVGQITNLPSAKIKLANIPMSASSVLTSNDGTVNAIEQCYVKDGTLSVVNDNLGIAHVGGLVGEINFVKSTIVKVISIKHSYNLNPINVKSVIYGQNFEIYAGGLVGSIKQKIENVGTADLYVKFEYVYATSKIDLVLRDLKQSTAELKDRYQIKYSNLVAHNDFKLWFHFVNNKSTVKFYQRDVVYNTTSENSHSLTLQYYKDNMLQNYIRPENSDEVLEHYINNFQNTIYTDINVINTNDVQNINYDINSQVSRNDFLSLVNQIWKQINSILMLAFE